MRVPPVDPQSPEPAPEERFLRSDSVGQLEFHSATPIRDDEPWRDDIARRPRRPTGIWVVEQGVRNVGDFGAEEADELWLSDVTYVATDDGWLYLCSILDV